MLGLGDSDGERLDDVEAELAKSSDGVGVSRGIAGKGPRWALQHSS
jgi:hypothetical protein